MQYVGSDASAGILNGNDAEAAWHDWLYLMGLDDKSGISAQVTAAATINTESFDVKAATASNQMDNAADVAYTETDVKNATKGGSGSEERKTWAEFLKQHALSVVAGRPNVATSGKSLIKYTEAISKQSFL